ncbi:MAG: CCXG family PEP-CTERM protein [Minicystis sp.]
MAPARIFSATTYSCSCPAGFSGSTCGCGIGYETRPYFGSAPPDTASAIAAFNAAPAGAPGYGSTALASFAAVSNQSLFGSIGNIAYHVKVGFDVTAADAGSWQVRLGADYGLGGTLLVDGMEVDFRPTDMWYAASFTDPTQYLSAAFTLAPGLHTIESYGFENCCDGVARMEYLSPTSGGWLPVTASTTCP